ncbi:MAG: hypothetical protein WC421_11575 [Elusimicrobiales bacterium]
MTLILKARYISLKQNGGESYVEDLPLKGKLEEYLPFAQLKLSDVRRLLPNAKWAITVEELYRDPARMNRRHYKIINAETGEEKTSEAML